MTSEQQEWQLRASIALDAAIAGGHLITYAELADAARIPAPQRIHKLTGWLETLLEDDHRAARPLRAAWVVSLIRMPDAIASLPATMLLQVHDELLFEVTEDAVDPLIAAAKQVMEGAADPVIRLDVPLIVDAGQGSNWADAH